MEDITDYIIERLGKLELQLHYIEESLQEDTILVKRRKLDDACMYPTQKRATDSGSDVYSLVQVELHPNVPTSFLTGLSIQMPRGYRCDIRPRSGLGKVGIEVLGGVIDNEYIGEMVVVLVNLSDKPILIEKHEKIAQLVFSKNVQVVWSDAEFEETDRGSAGFGSSGRF